MLGSAVDCAFTRTVSRDVVGLVAWPHRHETIHDKVLNLLSGE